MKTEDKAKHYAENKSNMDHDPYSVRIARSAFTDGANWQLEKTINKACAWLHDKFVAAGVDEERARNYGFELDAYLRNNND